MRALYVADWTTLIGATIEIRQQGRLVDHGLVDAVTDDGAILWLRSQLEVRKLYEQAEYYEAWMIVKAVGVL